ncbi:Toxin RTX-I translocation ATP-binding protein [Paenibacillus konkukensis]|uniref:Toxin RTX-I translocation ATP-binding protein n=1 Tax=Paenibacillus konkukensis TaxID=2020716 RepID=A0ABY4RP73_9BACL|nr:NHLP family bacteriocin export ABC transporter peptidase/permease/ATPase subunit [Paenibacillus konkukensis]UQZ83122.1 Toxin RTX-I translocation ATP-binding protein [Paenibacillus konkukensis]
MMASLLSRLRGGARAVTPTLLQMEAVECGAVSLAIVLAYYGRHIPVETLRYDCGVSRDGSKASNILKAARKYGMEAKGYKKDPENLKLLKPPFIVHWNFNHFLVVEGFAGGKAFLNDPAHGPYSVSLEEFDSSYTGVVLTMTPGEAFVREGSRFSVRSSLLRRLKGYEREVVYLVAAGIGLAGTGVLVPLFLKLFVDRMMLAGQREWAGAILLGMLVIVVLRALLTALRQYALLRMETKFSLSMAGSFVLHILRLPVGFFAQRFVGEIAGRAQANDRVAQFVTEKLAGTVIDVMLAGFYFTFMLLYDYRLALIAILVAALNVAYLLHVNRKQTDRNQKLQMDEGKLEGASIAGLINMESLKASGRESDFFSRWVGYQANTTRTEQALGASNQYLSAIPVLLEQLNSAIILVIGGLLVLNGSFTVGMLLAFTGFASGFLAPVNNLVAMGGEWQQMRGHLFRLDDVLNHSADTAHSGSSEAGEANDPQQWPPKLSGALAICNVTFGYSPLDPPLIERISLTVPPGATVAIVGGSGSGKSTLSKLLTGLYEPWDGAIRFDGRQRSELPRHVLANSVSLVDQDIRLFEGTVRDNLTLWDPTIPDAVVVQAAKDSCIHEIIAARAGGYDHMVEEDGRNFSGGQAQRLEIARALAQRPSILILDEATSALDPESEAVIYGNIRRRGCTCIIIAHRLSAIRDCDMIAVLDQGKLVQTGTHEELLRVEGHYRELFHASERSEAS